VATFAAVDRALAAHQLLGNLVQVGVDRAVVLPDDGVRFEADNPVFVAWGDKPGPADAQASPAVRVVVGIGCSSEATADEVAAVMDEALRAAGDLGDAPVELATIDARSEHPAIQAAAARTGARLLTFPCSLLGVVDVPNPSEVVAGAVGTPSVAEAAALLGAGPRGRLLVTKRKGPTATAAVATSTPVEAANAAAAATATTDRPGSLHIVGLGPGGAQHRTPAATTAVRQADAVVGYGPYVDAIVPLLRPDQLVVRSSMGAESDRAVGALALARAGWRVALVSSGDPGVFAMAARTLDLAANPPDVDVEVEIVVVPGVTAAHAAAAAAGAPLGGAHALVTLSDLLVPWPAIEAHLRAAAESGMALALYNPRSAGRPDHLARARDVLVDVLDPSTPVVVVTDATGPAQSVVRTTLSALDPSIVGMRSIVLVAGR
jgi:cobalt-precorrin 5A hydrolase/precorrin-3B C17-methyltransferase